jgi:hypothetical protein
MKLRDITCVLTPAAAWNTTRQFVSPIQICIEIEVQPRSSLWLHSQPYNWHQF